MNTARVAPRGYTLKRRAESAATTRERILDATLALYGEVGIPGTTIKAVADRADVARATVINHFGSAEGLLGATLDRIMASLELPDERIFRGLSSRDDRVRAYVAAMIAFQQRTSHLWPIFENELSRPAVQEREATYWAALAKLQAAALGERLAADPRANATLTSVIHPATVGTFLWSFEQAGLDPEVARSLLGHFAVDAVGRIARDEEGTE
jgi:AcrR family transcriptional regulator